MPIKLKIQFSLICLYCLISCGLSSSCIEKEGKRIKSPDRMVDAVLIIRDCGATTSESFSLYIVASGEKASKADLIFKADHLKNFSFLWRKPKFLELKYEQARIFQFMNFWQSKKVKNFAYVVEIRETPLSITHSLSASDRWADELEER